MTIRLKKKILRLTGFSLTVGSLSGSPEFPLTQRTVCPAEVSRAVLRSEPVLLHETSLEHPPNGFTEAKRTVSLFPSPSFMHLLAQAL